MEREISLGNKKIGKTAYFIADIAANHDGEIGRAFKLIELAKESGADVAKFQNFTAKKIVSKKGFDELNGQLSHQASWKKSVYETYEDASISLEWTSRLKKKCDEVGIEYMTSPYDFDSVDAVNPYVNAFKVGSGDITWTHILEYIAQKNKPVLIATGASEIEDVKRAYAVVEKFNSQIVIMQCNTNYTGSKDNFKYINLNVLKAYRKFFPNAILGLSDHTPGHATVLGAIALGATVIEKHFTDDNTRCGPDHKFSMNPNAWKEMVECANELFTALGSEIKRVEENEKETAVVQRRALYLTKDVAEGQKIQSEDIFPLRPIKDDGIPPYEFENVIGMKANKALAKDSYLKWEDIER
ncbi:N-acetylneuraminate synthase family protein [Acetobacterium carbinolicum]|uniref:N-acetylneuraminate synthase family protein n=1 Tax=Acetobacterium carbinolicum TaxID=52690 RepID=UPI0039C8C957